MVTPEEIAAIPLFASLDAAQRERLSRAAADVSLATGEYAAADGSERALFAVLEGRIEPTRLVDGIERVLGERHPGEIFGEVPIALGTVFPVGFRAAVPSRVMRLEPSDYHAIAAVVPEVGEELGRLAAHRMSGTRGLQGSRPSRSLRAQSSWGSNGCVLHRASALPRPQPGDVQVALARRGGRGGVVGRPAARRGGPAGDPGHRGKDRGPAAAAPGAELLGLGTEAEAAEYDTVIVGAGPAGLAAAVYGASEGLRTIVVEREAPGGQAGTSARIENYLGFPAGVSGGELASRALQQARRLGAEILVTRSVDRIDAATRQLQLDGGDVLRARTIILACGVSWRQLSVDGFDELLGKGISYGAARSEAPNTHGLDVHIVGAGNSAGRRPCRSPPTRAA